MSNLAYEVLGRVTWTVQKRKIRSYFTPQKNRRRRRIFGGVTLLVVSAVVAAELATRATPPDHWA
jgi:beta-lactamase regulating signal transducer with metallopeptidase domain